LPSGQAVYTNDSKDEDGEEDINSVDELWIKSVKDINAGDEITVDYGSDKTLFSP